MIAKENSKHVESFFRRQSGEERKKDEKVLVEKPKAKRKTRKKRGQRRKIRMRVSVEINMPLYKPSKTTNSTNRLSD